MLRKQLIAVAVTAVLSTSAWTAEAGNASKQEAAGVGAGAAIGAAAGGPVGFVLGAAFGGWLGDRFHREQAQRADAQAQADERRAEVGRLESQLGVSERETARLESALAAAEISHHRALEQALEVQVYFRTAESALNEGAEQRLTRIAEMIAPMDGVVVLLEGHADARGDEGYNEELSAQRAESVRQAFVRAGVPEDRIAVTAEGERDAFGDEKDLDALALDRRVAISVVGGAAETRVAQRSE